MTAKKHAIAKAQTTGLYKKILIGFSAVAFIMAALIVYYSTSKTVITVTLAPKPSTTTLSVLVRKNADEQESNLTTAITGTLTTVEENGSRAFDNPSTGEEVPAQATGTVTIYNNYSAAQPLAATTRLLTPDGVLFRIKDRVDIPAGGKVENVDVYADQPGASGNIEPTTFTIPGLWQGLQDKIYAESTAPMTGGLRSGQVITKSFINASTQTLIDELADDAVTDLSTSDANPANIPVSTSMLYPITLDQKLSADEGVEAASLTIDLRVKFIAVLFDPDTLAFLANQELGQTLPADEQLDSDSQPMLEYSVESYDLENESATLAVKYTDNVIPRLSSTMFNRDEVVGKDAQEIKTYFSHFDQIKDVQIKFSPFWVRKAPQLKDHIEIKLTK